MAMMRARGQPGRGQRSHRRSAWVSAPQVPEYASRASIGMSNALCKPGPCVARASVVGEGLRDPWIPACTQRSR